MQALFKSDQAEREHERRVTEIRDRLEKRTIAEARASRKEGIINAGAFVDVLSDIRSVLDITQLNGTDLKAHATLYIGKWNEFIATPGGHALILSHRKAIEKKETDLAIALGEDKNYPEHHLPEQEFEKVACDLVEDLAPDEKGSDEILQHHASILRYHIEIFSGGHIRLPGTNRERRALLLAMTPQGVLLGSDFRLIKSFSDQMMDKRGPTKFDHETLRTNANFVGRFPPSIIDRGGETSFTAAHISVLFPHSLKIATAYSFLLAPGLQRPQVSIVHKGNTVDSDPRFKGEHPARRLSEGGRGSEGDEKALNRVQTWSLATRRRKSVSAFQPVSRLSYFS